MKWLFVTSRFPWPLLNGHWLHMYHFTRSLRTLGEEVAILSYPGDEEGRAAYASVGVDVLDGPTGEPADRGRARTWLAEHPFEQALAEQIAGHAGRFEIIVLSGLRMLQYSAEAAAAGCVVADYTDDPVLEEQRRPCGPSGLRGCIWRIRIGFGRPRYEQTFLRQVSLATFVSDVDRRSFAGRHPGVRTAVIPNGVDVDYFRRAGLVPQPGDGNPTVVFTGHMSNPNNELAAVFLVQQVAPLIWERVPGARIQIVGADPTETVRGLARDRVEVTATVADIRPYLWDSGLVLLPMQSGTGVKNKLLEAWAAGAAVVATPLACQGVPTRHGVNLLVGCTTRELADCAIAVLTDRGLREKIACGGRATVLSSLTWQHVTKRLRQEVLAVINAPGVQTGICGS